MFFTSHLFYGLYLWVSALFTTIATVYQYRLNLLNESKRKVVEHCSLVYENNGLGTEGLRVRIPDWAANSTPSPRRPPPPPLPPPHPPISLPRCYRIRVVVLLQRYLTKSDTHLQRTASISFYFLTCFLLQVRKMSRPCSPRTTPASPFSWKYMLPERNEQINWISNR